MTSSHRQIAVFGVSGYAGAELARLLLHHPRLRGHAPVFFGRPEEENGARIALTDLHPQLADNNGAGSVMVEPFRWDALSKRKVDVVFLATPHEQSRAWAPKLLEHGMRVIDLSGAWRLDEEANRAIYKLEDVDPSGAQSIQQEAVYGMPELHRKRIPSARLVANPGCYSTSIILALAPLIREERIDLARGIVCDSKSGVSGAGKTPTAKTHFMHAADNLSAYSVFSHRHIGEMLEQLRLEAKDIVFAPHLLPIPRGIFSTVYVYLRQRTTPENVDACFRNFYADSPMVRWHGARLPEVQYCVRTSYCDLGFALASDGHRLIVVSCLDNLLKGAASQAVQNMNLMFGWPEQEGLA
ncbi:MAG: N-acetyl-gamma-glutamyl-phosphate reductase [Acidobacteriaceae bacterium]